jgi:hypothetical protein
MAAARSDAEISAVRTVARAEMHRRKAVERLARAKGAKLPGSSASESPEEYKQRMMARVQGAVPVDVRGVAAGRILDTVLADGINSVALDETSGKGQMGVDLAVGLAKQAGVSQEELDQMLKSIEDPADTEANEYLRGRIQPHLQPLPATGAAVGNCAASAKGPS